MSDTADSGTTAQMARHIRF